MRSEGPDLGESRGIFPGSGGGPEGPHPPDSGWRSFRRAAAPLRDGIKGTGERGIRRDPPRSAGIRRLPEVSGTGGVPWIIPPPKKPGPSGVGIAGSWEGLARNSERAPECSGLIIGDGAEFPGLG